LLRHRRPLTFRTRAELYSQLSTLEAAGLPFERAMGLLSLSGEGQVRLQDMRSHLANGLVPASAGERAAVFTKLEARLIQAAFNAGSPSAMYRRLADYCTDRAMQLSTMKARLMLPGAIFFMSLLLAPLPALVGGSIGLFGFVWAVVKPLALLAGLFYAVRWWFGAQAGDDAGGRLRSLPLYGPIAIRQNLRDFLESLALLLEAGVSMQDALPAALDTVQDAAIRRDLSRLRPLVEKGASLADGLRMLSWTSNSRLIEFVESGEAAGKLPEMLKRYVALETEAINGFYEQLAAWVPRVVYALVALSVAYSLIAGGGVTPRLRDI